MDANSLRIPFYIAALVCFGVALAIEAGSSLAITPPTDPVEYKESAAYHFCPTDKPEGCNGAGGAPGQAALLGRARQKMNESKTYQTPGRAIQAIALIDVELVLSVFLLGAGFLITAAVVGRIQGLITLIVSLLVLIASVVAALLAFALILVMVGLFLAVPFGTIAYLAVWGSFATGAAKATLSVLMILKIAGGVCLLLAQQRFIENKAMVLLVLTTIVAVVLVGFLHGFVPGILVSITDMIGALVVAIIAAIWALILLIFSIPGVLKAFQVKI